MELEFDKEIDAILRKARPNRGVLVGDDPPKKHLDADAISAFAENALPQTAKLLYMEHFADCDKCRKMLSHAILMNAEAVTANSRAASAVTAPVAETTFPWYQKLFKTPNLALAMGALVLVFSGVLGYLVLQNSRDAQNATVSQVTEREDRRGGSSFGGEATVNANMAALAANTAAAATNTATTNSAARVGNGTLANAATETTDRADASAPLAVDDKNTSAREVTGLPKSENAPAPAPPPPPVSIDGVAAESDQKKALAADRQKEDARDMELAKRKYSEERRSRDLPPAASKVGPSRSGPLQDKANQVQNKAFDMPVTRAVSGKTFSNRDGAWYDSAYRGQATVNFRRGTEEYNKLDRGLRNIADTLGGTVVVVWKGKAYRIQ